MHPMAPSPLAHTLMSPKLRYVILWMQNNRQSFPLLTFHLFMRQHIDVTGSGTAGKLDERHHAATGQPLITGHVCKCIYRAKSTDPEKRSRQLSCSDYLCEKYIDHPFLFMYVAAGALSQQTELQQPARYEVDRCPGQQL